MDGVAKGRGKGRKREGGRKGGEGREGKEGRGRKGGERDGRRTGGDGVGEGIDGGERDGRRMGGDGKMEGSETGGARVGTWGGNRWRGARREAHGWGHGGGGKMEGSETGGCRRHCAHFGHPRPYLSPNPAHAPALSLPSIFPPQPRPYRRASHHKHHGRLLRVSAQVERSMGGGSAGPCFADVCWVVSGAVLRG